MIARTQLGMIPASANWRGISVNGRRLVWNTGRGIWEPGAPRRSLGALMDQSFCDTAAWYNPLSYLCLPQDIKRVYAAATNTYDNPPGAAPPGAPQTLLQMTQPGAYTPAQSAADAHTNSIARWQDFFATQNPDGGAPAAPCSSWFSFLDSSCNPNYWVPLAAVGGFALLVLLKKGKRK
jgi:hypothetical protein